MGKRSRARGQRPPREAVGQRINGYHGTIATAVPAIQRHGLVGHNDTRAFITTDRERALQYALRTICGDLAARDLADRPQRARLAAVLVLTIEASAAICDPSHPSEYALTFCPPEWVTGVRFVNLRDRIPDADEVRKTADHISQARELENTYQDFRLGLVSGAERASQALRWAMESDR